MSQTARRHPGLNLKDIDKETNDKAEGIIFGFWIFLMSDLVVFALLFATYAVLLQGTAGGPAPGPEIFDLPIVAVETALLLVSSLTYGFAQLAMKYDFGARRIAGWLALTLVLGVGFLVLEVRDFLIMIGDGAVPSRSGYLSGFYALVGTHGLHVLFGVIWIAVMIVQIFVFGLTRDVKLRVLRLALFWHLLDVVWIGIFSVVYLTAYV